MKEGKKFETIKKKETEEDPEIEKLRREVEELQKEVKLETREGLKQKMREILAWGFVTLSGMGIIKAVLPEKPKEGVTLDQVLTTHINKDKKINKVEKEELWEKINYLKEQFGDLTVFNLQRYTELRGRAKPKRPSINGFDKLHPRLRNSDFQYIWNEKYYPKGWINERVGKIEYIESKKDVGSHYGLDSEKWKTNAYYQTLKEGKAKVAFLKPGEPISEDALTKDVARALDCYFGHEIGHANDWKEEDLDFKNRVEFLHEVTQYYFREGAFRDAGKYIESINNDDPQTERYCKVIEYWGEACEHYFAFPEEFREAWPAEFALVDRYVKKEDPDYNCIKGHEGREAMYNQFGSSIRAIPKDLEKYLEKK